MNDFQTITEIVNESVRNSSYVTVILSSTIFIVYTLIVKLMDYFKSKNKNNQLIEITNALRANTNNIVKLNSVLDKTLEDAKRKEVRQCERAIDLSFKGFAYRLSQECIAIIVHNNIDDTKDLVVGNVTKLVNAEYYKLYSTLSSYEINDVNAATKLKEEWIQEVAENLIAIIYNKQAAITRVTQVNNRLNIDINEYSTYVSNKLFNT